MSWKKIIMASLLAATFGSHANAEEIWGCPSGEDAREAIISGDVKTWPNYSAGPGLRVQQQHPDTALIAQAKFIGWSDNSVGVCQYYNHIGHVVTMVSTGLAKTDTTKGAYWRKEYSESTPAEDIPGREMMEVCMKKKKGLASPSIQCPFVVLE